MWWSRSIGASAIDCLIKVKEYQFTLPIGMILGTEADKPHFSVKNGMSEENSCYYLRKVRTVAM